MRHASPSSAESLSLEALQELTAPFAAYAAEPPAMAWSILRSGLVEEGLEVIYGDKEVGLLEGATYGVFEQPVLDAERKHALRGEIGDGWFYIAEWARFGGADPDEVVRGRSSLRSFQEDLPPMAIPLRNPAGESLTLQQDPRAVLGMAILRVVDVQNPKTPELWIGQASRPSLGEALGDAAIAYTYLATRHEVAIEAAIRQTLAKLASRPRRPAVINEAEAAQDAWALSSRRRRLFVVPWVRELALKSSQVQWESS